ncbi:hypothetical protein P343_15930 [Sporolactobacillus laevolacticus DSM 442]|uniref:Uncharacterized protein n=1 Tax=Sporolactobacillus laevolacticus DSM 442 TaxID=1395513 RepID=V6IUL3_9BACL|nr:hypothetical protein P343_15930 [Sporolactobacillus laevolacticus DSM 442]
MENADRTKEELLVAEELNMIMEAIKEVDANVKV